MSNENIYVLFDHQKSTVLEISIYIEQCYITLFDKKVQYSGKRCKNWRKNATGFIPTANNRDL